MDLRDETYTALQDDRRPKCYSQRWIMAYMGAWLGFMAYLLCMNMSVTVVCMVKQDYAQANDTIVGIVGNGSSIIQTRQMHDIPEFNTSLQLYNVHHNDSNYEPLHSTDSGYIKEPSSMPKHQTGEFTWDKKEQSFILSGYFYSYTLIQIPGGWLGAKYGGRHVIGISMTVACLMTLLTPVMARASVYLVVVARILLGLSLGMVIPTFWGLVGAWALPTERSRMFALLYFGQMVGAILAYSTSGILCVHGFDNGWGSVFYIHGIFGVAFVASWWYFAFNSPNEHPRITETERILILKHTKHHNSHIKDPPIPWKNILTHFPLYISYLAHVCDAWTFYLLLICLPQYLKEVLHFDIQSNGLVSCLPMVTNMIGICFAGGGADFLRSRTKFTITTIRKLFLISGFVGVSCFMLVISFLTSEYRDFAVMCISMCTLFEPIVSVGGYGSNSVDIAPKHASIIFGISNTFASIPGAIAPFIVAIITKHQTAEEWRIVFFISAGVSVFACVVYGLFANNEPAKWGDIREDIEIDVDFPIKSIPSTDVKSDMDI